MPLISAALAGANNVKLKEFSDKIIKNNAKPWTLKIPGNNWDHIDLIEISPGIASLKIYGGRMHCPKMQDLPIDPDQDISPEQRDLLRHYCANDLYTTKALFDNFDEFKKLHPALANLSPQSMVKDGLSAPLHEGAARFYQQEMVRIHVAGDMYNTPTHPVTEAKCEHIRDEGGNPFNELTLPDAVVKFRQGVGRLIRRASDRGVVTILDARVLAKTYGKLFLDALPNPEFAAITQETRKNTFRPFA